MGKIAFHGQGCLLVGKVIFFLWARSFSGEQEHEFGGQGHGQSHGDLARQQTTLPTKTVTLPIKNDPAHQKIPLPTLSNCHVKERLTVVM